jgi:hypothetical protein
VMQQEKKEKNFERKKRKKEKNKWCSWGDSNTRSVSYEETALKPLSYKSKKKKKSNWNSIVVPAIQKISE